MGLTRSAEEFEVVMRLLEEGRNDCEISRLTGIPRGTVRDWRWGRGNSTVRPPTPGDYGCYEDHDFSTLPPNPYSYLLGMYLGDGYIARSHRGVWRLRIVSDSRYPEILDECRRAMEIVMPDNRAYRLARSDRCVEIAMSSKHWICLFPQHGPGRKHERPIRLEPWQQDLVQGGTKSLLRGLIHSDGAVLSPMTEV